jgi:RNA polymerase sigma-70 factor, ECF subfamily
LQNTTSKDSQLSVEVEGIVDRAVSGDVEAFGRLYDIYADRIYRHIYYRTSSVEDARDLTNDVFIEAWKAIPRYKKTKAPFLAWLFTICRHTVIDYYRTKKDDVYLNNGLIADNNEQSPEKIVEEQFTQQEVRKAILQLPGDQQQVILMIFIEGFEYSEIATILKKNEGNIRVIVHRALKRMRDIMGKSGD